MANKGEDMVTHDECADKLSDVSDEFEDFEKTEDIASSEKQSETESSDDSEICTWRIGESYHC